jgi:hypothetical protein
MRRTTSNTTNSPWENARRAMRSRDERLDERLDQVLQSLQAMERRLAAVEDRLEGLQGSATRMDTHIDFITRTYWYLRAPLAVMAGLSRRLAPYVQAGGADGLLEGGEEEAQADGKQQDEDALHVIQVPQTPPAAPGWGLGFWPRAAAAKERPGK